MIFFLYTANNSSFKSWSLVKMQYNRFLDDTRGYSLVEEAVSTVPTSPISHYSITNTLRLASLIRDINNAASEGDFHVRATATTSRRC